MVKFFTIFSSDLSKLDFKKVSDGQFISMYTYLFVCLFVCVGPGYCIQCGSSNPLGFIGFSLKPKVLGVCNAPSTNGSYGYIGIGGGNLLTLPTPVVKPNTTPAVI